MGKSQIKSQVQITNQWQNDLNENLKSKIKSEINFTTMSIFGKCSVYIITIEYQILQKLQLFYIRS